MPRVSVIIPTYNRPQLLLRALASVYAQTYTDYEVIVVDDGATEKASDHIKEYLAYPNFRYFETGKNEGGARARNKGIKEAKGSYVAFLDDDDEWLPEKLAIQVSLFDALPHTVGFSFTSVLITRDEEQYITQVKDGVHDFSEDALSDFNGFLTVTQMIRTDVLKEVSGFDETFPSHQEAELIIRVTQLGYHGLGINQPLTHVNADSTRDSIGRNYERRIRGRKMLLEKHREVYITHSRALSRSYFEIGLWYRTMEDWENARMYMMMAYRTRPGSFRYFLHMLYTTVASLFKRMK